MKNPKLAAWLNLLPGLGYMYINRRRPFGWLLVVSIVLSVISYFDPAFKQYLDAPVSWPYMVIGFVGFAACEAAFVLDAYKEARRHNAAMAVSNEDTDLTEMPEERHRRPRGKADLGIWLCIILAWLYLQVIGTALTYDYASFGWSWLTTAADIITVASAAACIVLMHMRRSILPSAYAVTYFLTLGLYFTDQYMSFGSVWADWVQVVKIGLVLAIIAYLFKSKRVRQTLNR